MEQRLKLNLDAARGQKRKREQIEEALSTIRAFSLFELSAMDSLAADDVATVLCAKLGWKTFLVVQNFLLKLPKIAFKQIQSRFMTALARELSIVIDLSDMSVVRALTNKHRDLACFSLDECLDSVSKRAGIPFQRILTPPTEICLSCGCNLSLQSQPAYITVFEKDGPFPGMKFSLKCQKCKTHYGYSCYGGSANGYKFYDDERCYVEASNISYLSRSLCLEHAYLA